MKHTDISQSKKEDISYDNYDWIRPSSRPDWLIEYEESIKKERKVLKNFTINILKKRRRIKTLIS